MSKEIICKFFRAFPLSSCLFVLSILSAESVWATPSRPSAPSILEDSIPSLGRIAHSPDQLLRNAVARLNIQDTLGLILMGPNPEQLISLYKKLPEGNNASEVQLNFMREFYYMDNGKLLYRSLEKYGGKKLELISWKSNAPPVEMDGGGKILRDIEIWVMDPATHSKGKISFVQSIYASSEGCKIWGFQDHKGGGKDAKD